MDRQELVSFFIVICVMALSHFTSQVLQGKVAPSIRRRLKPYVEGLFPSIKMEPWLFEPIAAEDLPPAQKWFFETHTPAFVSRGFTPLGDFILRRDPAAWHWRLSRARGASGEALSCVRYFLTPDGTVVGGLTCFLGRHVIECMSCLLDGFYLETASTACPRLPPADDGLQFFPIRTNDAAALIEYHAICLAKTAASRNISPAQLAPTDLQPLVNHGRQLALRSLHQQGFLGELPDFLRDKSAPPQPL